LGEDSRTPGRLTFGKEEEGLMKGKVASLAISALLSVAIGVAQTAVTTTNGGIAGAVPVFTGTTNVERSVITQSNGNVGIGTTTPGAMLSLGSSTPTIPKLLIFDANNGWNMGLGTNLGAFGTSAGVLSIVMPEGFASQDGSSRLNIVAPTSAWPYASYATLMTVINSGNVGIGTTTPTTKLEVNGPVTLTPGSNGSITFPDGTVQTTAYPASSSGGSAPIQVDQNEVVINGGVSSNGSGIKHVRTDAACTTGSNIGNNCQIQVYWPGTLFSDTNYTVTCTPKRVSFSGGYSVGYDLTIPDANKQTGFTTVTISNLSQSTAVTVTGLNCIAIHD
jgi:hypothetical protein